ncbi:MAG: hypothetical protein KY462_16775 [Actinobacteria bacterium]|nr:hypothetical protein [Actinomycetota bacterium]
MNDQQLDALVASTAITDDEVAALDLEDAEMDLREAIVATGRSHGQSAGAARGAHRRRFLAVAAAVAAAALVLVVIQPLGRDSGTAWAEALVRAAEASPLLLVSEPEWKVTRADVYGQGIGEMTFSDGWTELTVHWRDPDAFDRYMDDRAHSADHSEELTVLGHHAMLFIYAGGNDFTTLLHDGDHTVEVRGAFPSIDAYRTVLLSLERVDVDTWLSAMPESVIASADRAAVVREMLVDIPQPDGFDAAALEEGPLRDRYQLGAAVSGAVACAWIEQWIEARRSGDVTATNQAVEAMRSSSEWDVLHEMNSSGDYPEVVWEYAAVMNDDGTVMGGRPLTVEESYKQALGCPR